MQFIVYGLSALAIANIYYWYRAYLDRQNERDSRLRERVAYMLWVAASRIQA